VTGAAEVTEAEVAEAGLLVDAGAVLTGFTVEEVAGTGAEEELPGAGPVVDV
jgi:hypothetical protein